MEELENNKKGGRPIKSKKYNKILRIRMNNEELNICKGKANSLNMPLATYLRLMIKQGKVTNLFTEEEQQHKVQLIGMANNLNQLMKEAHTYGLVSVEKSVRDSLTDIRKILDRYVSV